MYIVFPLAFPCIYIYRSIDRYHVDIDSTSQKSKQWELQIEFSEYGIPLGITLYLLRLSTPRWVIYKGKCHLEMDDLGVPPFQETSIYEKVLPPSYKLLYKP